MKYLFLACLGILIAASLFTHSINPETQSELPVLYWVTDPNPARVLQVSTFQEWLRQNGYPEFELRVDTANSDASKMLIQGVSGVGSDVIGHCGGQRMRYFQKVGLLTDVTAWAKELNFGPEHTFPAMEPELTVNGRQYAFPCNVYAHMLWVNKGTFHQNGVPLPPKRWTFEEFERQGKQFVEAANRGKARQTAFFVNGPNSTIWRRSLGMDIYNETMTRCILDDPRNVELLKRIHRWTYDDHIIPSAADREAFATESGYGGSSFQLFNSGNYAMVWCGRYALIQFREFGTLDLAVAEPPHGGFPVTSTGTRAAAVYIGGKHRDLAKYFLSYLASEAYNMNIVRDADALPPNPKYTKTEAYRRPLPLLPDLTTFFPYPDSELDAVAAFEKTFYAVTDTIDRENPIDPQDLPIPPKPSAMPAEAYQKALAAFHTLYREHMATCRREWGCHEAFSEAAETIAIPVSSSPFILESVATRLIGQLEEGFMADRETAEETARLMGETVNQEIQRALNENPKLRPQFDELSKRQEEIDQRRSAGRPVPRDWITNPFYRRYYVAQGWTE
ncbi:MAG: extracellular solute-binding protein [Lentisphaerae bacterium]|mgnify:CR=1 FL=1|jgi:multiple sugar transport system substrate-binding protein|nr:extracellular solute-binding protein [Lentisphaerota bacterium]MBT4818061.1 extracellular solute-binding protein [Lentisphaerota bacterium]MBT5610241.1 extracellular solute-binding protein [Lentisphaerota bacterium]MBT7055710.1 extracellular solute-binding protein [Lentisphaerota bacterium]MBT7846005.1 extracellular solute-binding protein [Lentisphaerota bacterium]